METQHEICFFFFLVFAIPLCGVEKVNKESRNRLNLSLIGVLFMYEPTDIHHSLWLELYGHDNLDSLWW